MKIVRRYQVSLTTTSPPSSCILVLMRGEVVSGTYTVKGIPRSLEALAIASPELPLDDPTNFLKPLEAF